MSKSPFSLNYRIIKDILIYCGPPGCLNKWMHEWFIHSQESEPSSSLRVVVVVWGGIARTLCSRNNNVAEMAGVYLGREFPEGRSHLSGALDGVEGWGGGCHSSGSLRREEGEAGWYVQYHSSRGAGPPDPPEMSGLPCGPHSFNIHVPDGAATSHPEQAKQAECL